MARLSIFLVLISTTVLVPLTGQAQSWFDAHLHYTTADTEHISVEQVIDILDSNQVDKAAVIGMPPANAQELYRHAPDRIVPVLGVYLTPGDKQDWHTDDLLPIRLRQELMSADWAAIGELHIFAENRHSPVLRRVIQLASRYQLPLLLHTDPAVIDSVYQIAPGQKVVWAHAGKYPYPDLLSDYLERYPDLYVDLSMRDARIAPDGEISDTWYELLVRYPGRFMLGVDTYSTQRWQDYDAAIATTREWLEQLPQTVRVRLAWQNAARIYRLRVPQNTD